MSVLNRPSAKRVRRQIREHHKPAWHDAYRHASFITAWSCLHSGHGIRPNRERRRGNLTHGRHGQFTHPMVGHGDIVKRAR